MQDWAKLRNLFKSEHLTRLSKGTYKVRLSRNKRRLMPFFVSLGSLADFGLVLKLLTMIYALDMHGLLWACMHHVWLDSTDGPLGRGKSAL